jgi:hypothetical protein
MAACFFSYGRPGQGWATIGVPWQWPSLNVILSYLPVPIMLSPCLPFFSPYLAFSVDVQCSVPTFLWMLMGGCTIVSSVGAADWFEPVGFA